MAYGQALNCGTTGAGNPGAPTISPTNPIELRAEGATELVSDTITPCNGSTSGIIQGNVTAYITGSGVQGITSPLIPKQSYSEATLAIIDNRAVPSAATVYYFGTIIGSQVTFGTTAVPVQFPVYNFIIQISNIRVNVTGTYPTIPQPVTETVFAGAQGVAALFTVAPQTVGYIRDGLQVTGSSGNYIGAGSSTAGVAFGIDAKNGNNPSTVTNGGVGTPFAYLVCQSGSNQLQPGFAITVTELFAGAFKTQSITPFSQTGNPVGTLLSPYSANIPGSESGSLVGTINGQTVGVANSGTRIKFVFSNIPANVTLSVPLSLSTGGTLTLNLDSAAETAAFTAATATSNNGGLNSLTISGGTATAIYEVFVANLTVIKQFTLPVVVGFSANAVVAPSGPITVVTSYSPSPATPGAALPATLPTVPYFANTGTVLNGSTFVNCQTTLLFPFITNEAGFETGIAIANTALDNLGTGGKSQASGQTGACTMYFYGSTGAEGGPQPATPTAPNFPAATLTPASIAPGTTHAATLSSVLGGPFQGYAIAVCPFLYARGFAFIEYGLATTSGVVEGYTADVLSANRQAGGVAAVSNNLPESSGQ